MLLRQWKGLPFFDLFCCYYGILIATVMTLGGRYRNALSFSQSFARGSAFTAYEQTGTSTHDFVESLDDKAEEIADMLSKFPKLIEVEGISTEAQAVFAEILARNP